ELVRRARLASADALDLGRVQRVALWPALALLLMANPQREIEQRAKAVFARCSSGAQLNALALGQLHQLLDRAMGEPGVGRMRDRLLLGSGIYRNPFEIFCVDRPGAVGHREALLQQRGDLLLTYPLPPARERRPIK